MASDLEATVNQLLETLNNKVGFEVEAKFSNQLFFKIRLIKELGSERQVKGPVNSEMIFFDGLWMPKDFYVAISPPPKTFHTDESEIKISDLDTITKKLDEVTGKIEAKKYLPKLKELSENYFEDPKDSTEKKLLDFWKEIEDENKAALESREKALSGIEKLIGHTLAENVKKTLLSIPDPKEAIKHLKDNFNKIKEKKEKKEEEKKPQGYVPEMDKDKKEFTVDDVKYILTVVKKNHKSGIDGIINPLKKYFNPDLLNTLVMAYRKYEGLEGLVDFLKNYDTKKDLLERQQPHMKLPANISEVLTPTEDTLELLKEVKESHPSEYKGSFLEYTEDVISLLLKYLRHGEKINKFEELFSNLFISGMTGDDKGILGQWSALKYPRIYDRLKKLRNPLSDIFKKPKSEKVEDVLKHLLDVSKGKKKMVTLEDDEKNKYVQDMAKLINNEVYMSEEDEELIKTIKDEDKDFNKNVTEKGLSEKELKEKRKKYREYQNKLKEKEEKEKYELMSPDEQKEYTLKKKQEEHAKDNRKKQRSEKAKERAKERAEKMKKEQEPKKSSSESEGNLPLFIKIENLIKASTNPIVKAELEDLLSTLKTVI